MPKGRPKKDKTAQARQLINEAIHQAEYNSEAFLKERTLKVDDALIKACERGSPAALKVYYQLTNRLVEKQEQNVKMEISAADHLRIREEAQKRIKDFKQGKLPEAKVVEIEPVEIVPEVKSVNDSDFPF